MRKTLSLALLVTPFVLLSACHDTHNNSVDNGAANAGAMDDNATANSVEDNMVAPGDSAGGNTAVMSPPMAAPMPAAVPVPSQADRSLSTNGSNGGHH